MGWALLQHRRESRLGIVFRSLTEIEKNSYGVYAPMQIATPCTGITNHVNIRSQESSF